jgi:hypothetical protein
VRVVVDRAAPATGNAYPVKGICTSSRRGRAIERSIDGGLALSQAAFYSTQQERRLSAPTDPFRKMGDIFLASSEW